MTWQCASTSLTHTNNTNNLLVYVPYTQVTQKATFLEGGGSAGSKITKFLFTLIDREGSGGGSTQIVYLLKILNIILL